MDNFKDSFAPKQCRKLHHSQTNWSLSLFQSSFLELRQPFSPFILHTVMPTTSQKNAAPSLLNSMFLSFHYFTASFITFLLLKKPVEMYLLLGGSWKMGLGFKDFLLLQHNGCCSALPLPSWKRLLLASSGRPYHLQDSLPSIKWSSEIIICSKCARAHTLHHRRASRKAAAYPASPLLHGALSLRCFPSLLPVPKCFEKEELLTERNGGRMPVYERS